MCARAMAKHQNGAVLHNTLACVQIYGKKKVKRGQKLSIFMRKVRREGREKKADHKDVNNKISVSPNTKRLACDIEWGKRIKYSIR